MNLFKITDYMINISQMLKKGTSGLYIQNIDFMITYR